MSGFSTVQADIVSWWKPPLPPGPPPATPPSSSTAAAAAAEGSIPAPATPPVRSTNERPSIPAVGQARSPSEELEMARAVRLSGLLLAHVVLRPRVCETLLVLSKVFDVVFAKTPSLFRVLRRLEVDDNAWCSMCSLIGQGAGGLAHALDFVKNAQRA